MNTENLLQNFKTRGIELFLADEKLRYRAMPGSLTVEDRERIRENRAAILQALKKPDAGKLEAFLERSAIMEFDGGLPRQEAEYRAFRLVWPEGSCTMLGAPTTVQEALAHARAAFGEACEASPIEASREAQP